MADFAPAFERVLLAEGGYQLTNNTNDRGQQTYAGISRRSNPTWTGWAYIDQGQTPPSALVRERYRAAYWDPLRLDALTSQAVAESIYGCAVNSGVKVAAKLAQVAIGTTPDGDVGPKTIAALNGMSDPSLFLARFTVAKIARYRDIVTKDKTQRQWLLGWINRALAEGGV